MNHVAHQTIVMQFILELARSLELDPRGCIRAFFSRSVMFDSYFLLFVVDIWHCDCNNNSHFFPVQPA